MSFRTRLYVAFATAAVLPLVVLAAGLRREMGRRVTAQYEDRIAALAAGLEADLARESAGVAARLAALREVTAADNRFRRAVVQGLESERGYLLDYAGGAMRLAGLSMLRIQDESGRILSSGHFRHEYDRLDPDLPATLAAAPGGAVVKARTPDGHLLTLARLDSLRLGDRRLTLLGGVTLEPRFLARSSPDADLSVALRYPGDAAGTGAEPRGSGETDAVVAEIALPFVDATEREPRLETAELVLTQSLAPLRALRRSLDLWFGAAAAATLLLAFVLALWFSSRISRPIRELARKTGQLDLDRLDVDFASDRRDEIGTLSRWLGAMTERLRASAARLREAERRAATGDLARQVNHDVRNGLIPLRNVFRHLAQVARERPGELPAVWTERQGTVESGLSYLETLAASYARLTPRLEPVPCDLHELVRAVARDGAAVARLDLRFARTLPPVLADPVALRRILDNLIANALDSLESQPGAVTVSTEPVEQTGGTGAVRITVADTGRGMAAHEVEKAFGDFYTTKEGGRGLGLSIVRRLVRDSAGTIRVESEPGRGSRFIVELPAAPIAGGAAPDPEKGPAG